MGVILSFLGSSIAAIFTDAVLKWIAFKSIMVFLFLIVVPLLLNNFLYEAIEIMMNFAASQATGATAFSGSMTFSGFMGWLLTCFRIPEVISIMVSALALRSVLLMVPFVRLVG